MPGFEYLSEAQLQPEKPEMQLTNIHDAPLYVVAFKESDSRTPNIITPRGGHLFRGVRNIARPIERDANDITQAHGVVTSAHARLHLPNAKAGQGMGYSVRRSTGTALPDMADFVHHPVAEEHSLPLELHDYFSLVARLEKDPAREIELAYLQAFGSLALSRLG